MRAPIQSIHTDYMMKIKMFFYKVLHFVVSIALFFGAWTLFRYGGIPVDRDVAFRYNYFVTIFYAVLLLFFNNTYNSYLFGYTRIRLLAFSQFLSQLFSVAIVFFAVSIAWSHWRSPVVFFGLLAIYVFVDIFFAYFGNLLYFHLNGPRRTLLIYRNAKDRKRIGSMSGKPTERLYKIIKEIEFDGPFEEIREELEQGNYDAVFVAGVNSRCRNGILKYCELNNVRGFFLPHVGDVIMQGAQHIQSFDTPVLMARRMTIRLEYRAIKRAFDVVASLLGLVILSPVMLLTAIAIKAYDHGPVFYKQVRLTRDGKTFRIIKFRSMRVDAEKDGVARLSTGDKDDRITPVGRIVRACRLDELPQLWNILVGDMSIVGPRPERPEIAEQYYRIMPDFKLRLQVKAGLTGYAQVYGKYNTDPYEKLEFDLLYINKMSILIDLELIFATFAILFSKESTTGVVGVTAIEEEQGR